MLRHYRYMEKNPDRDIYRVSLKSVFLIWKTLYTKYSDIPVLIYNMYLV